MAALPFYEDATLSILPLEAISKVLPVGVAHLCGLVNNSLK